LTKRDNSTSEGPTPFERLRDFARRVVAVPKAEIDEQEAEYQLERAKLKAPRPRKNL
jgi:hypothetical protein